MSHESAHLSNAFYHKHIPACFSVYAFYGFATWVTVDVNFGGAGRRPGEHALIQGFGSCGVLGLFNAGAFCLPHLLPESQLHGEDLEERHEEGRTSDNRDAFTFLNRNYWDNIAAGGKKNTHTHLGMRWPSLAEELILRLEPIETG